MKLAKHKILNSLIYLATMSNICLAGFVNADAASGEFGSIEGSGSTLFAQPASA